MRFRIGTILWAFALLAAAMSTFGLLGILCAFLVVLSWALVFERKYPSTEQVFFLLILSAILFFSFVVSSVPFAQSTARHQACRTNLEEIGRALLKYQEQFPLSPENWRADLLPFLLENSRSSLALSGVAAMAFQCPEDTRSAKNFASYFAIVDPHSPWTGSTNSLAGLPDGPANTILLLETHNHNVAWTSSKNLSFEEAVEVLCGQNRCHWREGRLLERPTWVCNVLFADGKVRSLNMPLTREFAVALLTADGGEVIDPGEFERLSHPEFDYKKVYALSLFAALLLLPLLKLIGRHKERKGLAAI